MLSRRKLLGTLASTVALQPISASADMTCSAPNQLDLQECTAGLILGTVETVRQRCPEWCWAACIQAVLALHGRQVDQEYAVERVFGRVFGLTCEPATPAQIIGVINNAPWQEVRDTLNRSLRGWSNYFCYGTRRSAFRSVDRYTYERVRDFLARRHKVAGRGTRRFSYDAVYGELGLLRLERLPLAAASCALR